MFNKYSFLSIEKELILQQPSADLILCLFCRDSKGLDTNNIHFLTVAYYAKQ